MYEEEEQTTTQAGHFFCGRGGHVFLSPDPPGYLLGLCACCLALLPASRVYWALHQGKAHLSYE